jgi:hypothetical protein
MKLSDFILLNEEDKTSTVLHQGVLIAKRNEINLLVFLFQLENFYVETHCHLESKLIHEFVAFKGTRHLTPYLDKIRLDDLLS